MTDDQFQTIVERAHELQGVPVEGHPYAFSTDDRLTFGSWRAAIEEHVARVVANLKAQHDRTLASQKAHLTERLTHQ